MTSGSFFPRLFEPIRLGPLQVRNRLALGPHGTWYVDGRSHLDERQANYLGARAKGGVGLIIQGSGAVHATGLPHPSCNAAWDDEAIPGLARIASAVHEHGAAVVAQMHHAGRQGDSLVTRRELWAPSAVPDPADRVVPHAMTRRELRQLADAHVETARRFMRAGFDGVELYMTYGYLLCQFLSATANVRTDEYGGSLENRIRFPLEVLEGVREAVGDWAAVGVRISGGEATPTGLTLEDSCEAVAELVQRAQIDWFHVTVGCHAAPAHITPDMSFPVAAFAEEARAIRQASNGVPVMANNRITGPDVAERLLTEGVADMVCMVRPLIADPELPNKARAGRVDEIRRCVYNNIGCVGSIVRSMPLACLVNPAVGREGESGVGTLSPAPVSKRVLVVGGGPAGLKAAEIATMRGHDVVLLEASEQLGGQVLVAAAAMPYRDEFANLVRDLENQLGRLKVDVRTAVTATAATVGEYGPDVVVVATGSIPGRPPIAGADLPFVGTAHDAIRAGVDGERVVIVDSGEADWKSLTTAERLAADGHQVTVVTPVMAGMEIDPSSRVPLLGRLVESGVRLLESRSALEIQPGRIRLSVGLGTPEEWIDTDAVVLAWFGIASDSLYHQLDQTGQVEVHAIGDCLAPRRAINAIWDGFRIGNLI